MILSILLLGPVPLTRAQEQDWIEKDVEQVVAQLEGADPSVVWYLGREISSLGSEVLPSIHERIEDASPQAKLGLARALVDLGDRDWARSVLVSLLDESTAPRISVAAAMGLGSRPFRKDPATIQALAQRMRASLDPDLRIASAKALWNVADLDHDDFRFQAKDTLGEFLRSKDTSLRLKGALALAEIGDRDTALPVLREFRTDPTPQGELVRAYLEKYDWQDIVQRRALTQKPVAAGRDLAFLEDILRLIHDKHPLGEDVGRDELLDAAAKGMLSKLDPYSEYLSAEELRTWSFQLERDYAGIGAYVDIVDNTFTITRPIYSGPAYEAGLRSRDMVLEVDGWETADRPINDVIRRLKGEPGTEVNILVMRQGWTEPRRFTLKREAILVPSVAWEFLPGDIGYVELSTFGRNSAQEVEEAVQELQGLGARGLVLDVRRNHGGFLPTALQVADLFLPKDTLVVYTEGRSEPRHDFKTLRDAVTDLPLVVLIDGGSASASEIVSGALQDWGRATLVGERSFGKGSVQQLFELPSQSPEWWEDRNGNHRWDEGEEYHDENLDGHWDPQPALKLTVSSYYLPKGRSIHTLKDPKGRILREGGVVPDVKVHNPEYDSVTLFALDKIFEEHGYRVFRDWVREHQSENRELFVELSEGDGKDWHRYPGFEEFYESLKTPLPRDDIRKWLRAEIRRQVSDDRGKVFPHIASSNSMGDYQEDLILQRGIRILLEKVGTKLADVAAYAHIDHFGEELETVSGTDEPESTG